MGSIEFAGKVSELLQATCRELVVPDSHRSCNRRGRSGQEILYPEW